MILDEKIANGDLIVLDGAIGSEIDRLGGKMDAAAWCGVANVTDPDTVRRVHEAYLEAGADIITANTFASCRHVLEAAGYGDQPLPSTDAPSSWRRKRETALHLTEMLRLRVRYRTTLLGSPEQLHPIPNFHRHLREKQRITVNSPIRSLKRDATFAVGDDA